jgi:hypothetical protein
MTLASIIDCPECGLPAEVRDRFRLPTKKGPIEHVKTRCLIWHVRTLPSDRLRSPAS